MPAGRPSDYTDDLADMICLRLASGESLRAMCKADKSLPAERTVYRWLLSKPEFCQKYSRAREFQAESHLEDIFEIADMDGVEPNDKKVRIDARKWAMSRLAAKKYGDRQLIGSDPDNPLPGAMSDQDLARLMLFHLTKTASLADAASANGASPQAIEH